MSSKNEPVEIYGAPGSPYTRKMLAVLRFRRVPYVLGWDGHMVSGTETRPAPKVSIIPIMYFATDSEVKEVAVDSTPIIRRLENDFETRSVIPTHPALAFLNFLIEDFADEWVTKFMFHYRWAHDEDAKHAAPLLAYWHNPTLDPETAGAGAARFAERQIGRLSVVGSNETTGPLIEASFARLIDILDALIMRQGYVLGARPSSADFALFGQLT
ncbi:MAG: glutathione S-transferase family protein, partial [Pseudomonadota bacterium]|nr:glutathione S-transferase family protein [Pseudomonadota bacterium]